MNSASHLHMLQTEIIPTLQSVLTEDEFNNMIYQQDGSPIHITLLVKISHCHIHASYKNHCKLPKRLPFFVVLNFSKSSTAHVHWWPLNSGGFSTFRLYNDGPYKMIICVYENGEFHGFLFLTIVSSLFREVMQVLYNVFGPHRIWSRNNTAHLLHVHIIFPPKSPGTVISN